MEDVTLTEFLTARLDEDEAVARAVVDDLHGGDCDLSENEAERHEVWEPHPGGDCPTGWQTGDWTHNHLSGPSSLFIRHTSPERALREVEAKREIVALAVLRQHQTFTSPWVDALLALASVYADHPDYPDEWKA